MKKLQANDLTNIVKRLSAKQVIADENSVMKDLEKTIKMANDVQKTLSIIKRNIVKIARDKSIENESIMLSDSEYFHAVMRNMNNIDEQLFELELDLKSDYSALSESIMRKNDEGQSYPPDFEGYPQDE